MCPTSRSTGLRDSTSDALGSRPPSDHQLMHDDSLDTQRVTHAGEYVCVSDLEDLPVTGDLELSGPFTGLVEAEPDVSRRSRNTRTSDPQESVGTSENTIVWAHSIGIWVSS